jgi:hypothetical protein
MRGGRLISFVVVAHALLTTASAITLAQRLTHYTSKPSITFSFRTRNVIGVSMSRWWWGRSPLCLACSVPCLQPLSLGLEFAPSPPRWSQQALQTFLVDLRTLQGHNIQNTLLEPKRT